MVLDYSQRKAVSKNRPKKQPVGLLIPLLAVAVVVAFSGGLFTGWLLFHGRGAGISEQVDRQAPAPQAPNPATAAPASHQSLTFYETLSKGHSNSIIGSGINTVVPVQPVIHKPEASTSPTPAAEQKQAKVPAPTGSDKVQVPPSAVPAGPAPVKPVVKPVEPVKTAEATKSVRETFAIQVGSYKNRAEADEMVTRSRGAGLPAYVVEARTDKGTWYRVRVGKKLDQETASKLAAKAGKGAITVPE